MKFPPVPVLGALLLGFVLSSCASTSSNVRDIAETPSSASKASLQAEIDALEWAEVRWRLPNSHASLDAPEERDLRQEMLRGYVLLQTARVGASLQPEDVLCLGMHLSSLAPSEEHRIFVVVRLLATAGVGVDAITENLGVDARESGVIQELLPKIIREGTFLNLHGMAYAKTPGDAQARLTRANGSLPKTGSR